MTEMLDDYHELYAYTMGRPRFILQHVVDAHLAQTATAASKPIGVIFALAGLYLPSSVDSPASRSSRRTRGWPSGSASGPASRSPSSAAG